MIHLRENDLFGDNNRYRLIRLLGQGGYSEVWLAKDEQVDLTVAIKIYAPGKGLDEDGVTQFSKEFKMVFNLNHANLLRPTHYDVYERMPYLIMPYCERGSSFKLAGKIDENMAWQFLYYVASGLAYLHAQESPVIHQDIKPDNILIDSSNSFVITDFGISAKVRTTLPSVGPKAGTMTYMAPERFNMEYQPIKASDVWALGASLFELMIGKPPFGEHGGIIQEKGAEIPNISGEWSAELKDMIMSCLQKKTWDRPTAKAIVEKAKQFIPEIPRITVTESVRSRFFVVLASGMLLLGLGAWYGIGYYLNQSNPKLSECIQIMEQGDAAFNENDLSTWRTTLMKYQEAKELTEQNSLQLPTMEHRIKQLRTKMDIEIRKSIDNAKRAFAARSEMALSLLKEALELDPDHEEAKALYEQYRQSFPNRE